jgi:hypothetical protein
VIFPSALHFCDCNHVYLLLGPLFFAQVVESGTHHELLARPNSRYSQMWALQAQKSQNNNNSTPKSSTTAAETTTATSVTL